MASTDFQNGFINGFVAGSTHVDVTAINKRDTETAWLATNPVLADGEQVIVDLPNGEIGIKVGNGEANFADLPYIDAKIKNELSELDAIVSSVQIELQNVQGDLTSHANTSNAQFEAIRNEFAEADRNNLVTALEYSDSKKNEAVSEAKAYTDSEIEKLVTDTEFEGILSTIQEIQNAMATDEELAQALETTAGTKVDKGAVGSSTQPIYFDENGAQPIAYKIEKDLPADAKLTDTTYTLIKDSTQKKIQLMSGETLISEVDDNNTTYELASTDNHGLMSKEDKAKLDDLDGTIPTKVSQLTNDANYINEVELSTALNEKFSTTIDTAKTLEGLESNIAELNYIKGARGNLQTQIDQLDAEVSSIIIDTELNDTSENPVQNKVLKAVLDNKADKKDIPSVAGLATETYVTSKVNEAVNNIQIPSKLSELNEDATHRVVTDSEKATWSAKSDFSGDYNDLTNKPDIPSIEGLVSEGYVTSKATELADNAKSEAIATAKTYTESKTQEIQAALTSHAGADTAHSDIRSQIASLVIRLNSFLTDDTIKDSDNNVVSTLADVVALINKNTENKINIADIVDALTSTDGNKVLSAKQGKELKTLISNLETALSAHKTNDIHVAYSTESPKMDGTSSVGTSASVARADHIHPSDTSKAAKSDFDKHTANTVNHITADERATWNNAKDYTDAQITALSTTVNTHVTNATKDFATVRTEINAGDTSTLSAAKAYTNEAIAGVTPSALKVYTKTEVDSTQNTLASNIQTKLDKKADLDDSGLIPAAQLPSYVDDIIEKSSKASFPTTGETGKIYVDTSTNLTYRWGGSAYVEISPSLALGETSSTAYRGDLGKVAYTHAVSDHLYAGSSAKGGSATSAVKLDTTTAGTTNKPVYFADGKPVAISYTIDKSVPSNAVFTDTDTKVTAVGNHYSPAADSAAALNVDASSSTAATWGSTSLVTGVNLQRDAKGHVTGMTVDSIRLPANPDTDTKYTHPSYTSKANGLYTVTVDSTGHISSATKVTKADITALGIPGSNTTYSVVSTSADGLAPKRDGSTSKFLRADGTWATPPDNNTVTTVETSGSGNAITSISATNGKVTATKGSTFLTAHPTISKSTDTTSASTASHGGTITMVDSITRDGNGHVTKVNTKTVTLPGDNNTDTKVTNELKTTTKAYVTGTTSASTNTGTQVFDTGVYLDTTAGRLAATSFKIGEGCNLVYDSTNKCVSFQFI